jgi:DNA-binding response OmpR family regulator
MIKVLVVDSNLVYARKVSQVLEKHTKDIEVDIAHNIFILRDRLKKNEYSLILADIMSASHPSELAFVLEEVQTPVILWTFAKSLELLRCSTNSQVMEKPVDPEEVSARLSGCFASLSVSA